MPDLPYWLWWTQNEGIRVLFVGLLGALVGGGFTLWGQSRAARAQAARDERARQDALVDQRREQSLADVRALFTAFVDLQRSINDAPHTVLQWLGDEDWGHEWKKVWTSTVSSRLRTQAELVPDETTRTRVLRIVHYLDDARRHSAEAAWQGHPDRPLLNLVHLLSGEGIDVVGAYLRHDKFKSKKAALWSQLAAEDAEYKKWGQKFRSAGLDLEVLDAIGKVSDGPRTVGEISSRED